MLVPNYIYIYKIDGVT